MSGRKSKRAGRKGVGGAGHRRPGGIPIDAQLQWVTANRQLRRTGSSIGELAARMAEQDVPGSARFGEVFDAVSALVDDLFRRHCRLVGLRAGDVILLVDEPDLRYHFEKTWALALKQHLEQTCRSVTIGKIVFKLATGRDAADETGLSFA